MLLHIDMDAFYASVEELDHPEWKGQCVIVGGTSNRGVVSAANYVARQFGVHSAMPIFQARQKCPQAIYAPPRMERYAEVSRQVMAVLRGFSPLMEQVSIDEAYLDISGCERLFGPPRELGLEMKRRIRETVQLTSSIGIAPLKFLAKIASDLDKPDGLYIITPEEMPRFLDQLLVERIPGVGKAAHTHLLRLGIKTLGDVARYPEKPLRKVLGKFGERLRALSQGIDKSRITPHAAAKSISRERTLGADISDKAILKKYLLAHAQRVARDLRRSGFRARTVTLKIKESDFKLITRSHTLAGTTVSSRTLYRAAAALLDAYTIRRKVRLIGLGASGLVTTEIPSQMTLFAPERHRPKNWERVDQAVDAIAEKYGTEAVTRATLTDS